MLANKHGEYIPELMAYMRDIIRVSKQFKWPAWIVFDTNYCQHMAETRQKNWSKVDPSIYSRCLTGWARPTSWCEWCVSLDHDSNKCPFSSARGKDQPPAHLQLPEQANPQLASNIISTEAITSLARDTNTTMYAPSARSPT